MEEINHFNHTKHSLKLFENLEVIVAGGDNGIQGEVNCDGCLEPISSGSVYGCISCRYFLHRACAQLEHNLILHNLDSLHPLILDANTPDDSYLSCDLCDRKLVMGLRYSCDPCEFDYCIKCIVDVITQNVAYATLKEVASVKFEHEGHPQHTLTFQLRSASFCCNACRDKNEDFFYQCDNCDFWIHKTCASLDLTIDLPHVHNHSLFLAYSLPQNFYKFAFICEICSKRIMHDDWIYHCANCRFFIHIKCIMKLKRFSTRRDEVELADKENYGDLLQFPMSEKFTDPLKLQYIEKKTIHDNEKVEIEHWSHTHMLSLNVDHTSNDIDCIDEIKVCHGCVRPLSLPYYSCKDGCSFTLHKYCVELPPKLDHPLHPDHSLELINVWEHSDYHQCDSCISYINTFCYKCEPCNFNLDVNCAFLPNTIKHKSHKHPLIQVIDSKSYCNACNLQSYCSRYACQACSFILDMHCAVRLPSSLAHRYCKGHEIPLTYPPVIDHPEDFFCDICETEMHPKYPLYYCHKCKNSFHIDCISPIDYNENIFKEGTQDVSYHKHPLTYVRRKKTPKYVCSICNCDINGFLVLECRARICGFIICLECHYNKATNDNM